MQLSIASTAVFKPEQTVNADLYCEQLDRVNQS